MAGLVAIIMTACLRVGPDYERPQLDVPETWSGEADTKPSAPEELSQWWRQFEDPVLNELVSEALAANLDLATAHAQLREARAQRRFAVAELGPSADVSASRTRTTTLADTESQSSESTGSGDGGASDMESATDDTQNLYNTTFDAIWEIDIFGGLRRGLEAAEADLEASVENLRDTQVSLIGEVVLNYVDLRTAQKRLGIAESNLVSFEENYNLAQWRKEAGLVTELDVKQALTELESARATLPSLRASAASSKNRLAVLLGVTPEKLPPGLEAAGPIPLAHRPVAVGIPADALRRRPDVRSAERNLAAQTARVGEATAERYPRFTLSGSFVLESMSSSALYQRESGVYSLIGSLAAPLFDSGRIRSNISVQDALLEQSLLAYRLAVLSAIEEVENALSSVANANQRRINLGQAAESAREYLELAQQQYSTGLVDFLAVLDAQRTVLELEDQVATSTGELATGEAELYKALGGGWAPPSDSKEIL